MARVERFGRYLTIINDTSRVHGSSIAVEFRIVSPRSQKGTIEYSRVAFSHFCFAFFLAFLSFVVGFFFKFRVIQILKVSRRFMSYCK